MKNGENVELMVRLRVTGSVVLLAVALAIAWHTAAIRVDNSFVLPTPLSVLRVAYADAGEIVSAVCSTLGAAALAYLLAITVGIVVVALGLASPTFCLMLLPVMVFFQVSPVIVFAQAVHAATGGATEYTRVILGMLVCVFPLCVLPLKHLSQLPRARLDAAIVMGASRLNLLIGIKLPWGALGMLNGARVAAPLAVVGVTVAEMIYPIRGGIGHILVMSVQSLRTDLAVAVALAISVVAYVCTLVIEKLISSAIHWMDGGAQSGEE